jgi:hypothetical protein
MIFKQNSCQVIFYSIFIFSALKAEINIVSSFNFHILLISTFPKKNDLKFKIEVKKNT